MTAGPGWDPFDGVPGQEVFARRYLKGVAYLVLWRVVGGLALTIALRALVARARPCSPSSPSR